MTRKIAVYTLTLGILSFGACKKENKEDETPNYSELIAGSNSKTWKVIKRSQDGIDVTNQLNSCQLDDLFKMKADKKYEFTEGASKCNSTDPDTWDTGTWSISSDGKTFTLTSDYDTSADAWSVESLSATKFVVSQNNGGVILEETYQSQ